MAKAKKSLGQHFLKDHLVIADIIEALAPAKGETVLEIGPGEGVLTLPLVNSGADVVAVELDRRLAPELEAAFAQKDNFKVIEADILSIDPAEIGLSDFAMIGNLPYNITTPIMEWLLTYYSKINRAVLMMQKEVAERVSSPPGRKSRASISVILSLYYDCELVCAVPPEAFSPPPRVDSAVVRFVRHNRQYDIENLPRFEKLVRNCFKSKRKSLLNNLNSAYPVQRDKLTELLTGLFESTTIRAEQLSLDDFIKLSQPLFELL